jgi:hypothetical protein
MSFKISCYTLFDITQTGVINRGKPGTDEDIDAWLVKRNTQCNFDTILQVISLRSQPEDISKPKIKRIAINEFQNFGKFEIINEENKNN